MSRYVSFHGLDLTFLRAEQNTASEGNPPKSPGAVKLRPSRPPARSELPCPYIATDRVEYRSMIDGSMITGRRQHREHLKRHGCTEVGNEKPTVGRGAKDRAEKRRRDIRKDVETAMRMVNQGYKPKPLERASGRVRTDGAIARGDVFKSSDAPKLIV